MEDREELNGPLQKGFDFTLTKDMFKNFCKTTP
jgi:hypothetical protein